MKRHSAVIAIAALFGCADTTEPPMRVTITRVVPSLNPQVEIVGSREGVPYRLTAVVSGNRGAACETANGVVGTTRQFITWPCAVWGEVIAEVVDGSTATPTDCRTVTNDPCPVRSPLPPIGPPQP